MKAGRLWLSACLPESELVARICAVGSGRLSLLYCHQIGGGSETHRWRGSPMPRLPTCFLLPFHMSLGQERGGQGRDLAVRQTDRILIH